MSKSHRLKISDVCGVFHLVREICELGEDPRAWRAHMLEGICRMTGASAAMTYVAPLSMAPGAFLPTLAVEHNVDPSYHRFLQLGDASSHPGTPAIVSLTAGGFSRSRRELCEDASWYGSTHFNELLRKVYLDDQLISHVALPHMSRFNGIGLSRELGDKIFGARESKLLKLLHEELAMLWHIPPLAPDDPATKLPPQLRRVIELLGAGMSERQTAIRMGLSQHTVHSYLKVLHRRFGATSRVELVERTRSRRAALRPRLEGT